MWLTHFVFYFLLSKASAVETFDVKSCRSKLAEHYQRTATVPTSVWTRKSLVDIHQMYTRLSWVKEEQNPSGSSQSELAHYTEVFTANKNGVLPKRILVQGQTGIGKSTFVKKLAVDWAELDDEITGDTKNDALTRCEDDGDGHVSVGKDATFQDNEDPSRLSGKPEDMSETQKESLNKFKLVLVINLKEVSKCPSLREIIHSSSIFPEEETALVDDLLSYITKNQEKVLLVFDGYDEYRCRRNSEIYEIFRRKKLRNCCVLITTRISKADELREFKDVHAEITGFSEVDRFDFMSKVLGSEAEAAELEDHLSQKKLTDLTRIPLLLLFFCTLWKKEKLKSFPENKTKLYFEIVQYVLNYNQGKDSPARFGKVQDFKEVLAGIGKVALECLLKDDHVFEYDQLSAAILCDESVIIGLLQVTEYAENLRPSGMVSFIHKSIQEFLSALFITYKCVPEGNLGEIEQHARTIEKCKYLENVFQFICGLSNEGAVKVLKHLTSVRKSDPTLDFPDVEIETDVPLCDVTYRHERFSELVYDSFREVQLKAKLLSLFLDCTGGVILVTGDRLLSELIPDVNVLIKLARNCVFILRDSEMYESLKFLNCLQLPAGITESSEVLKVEDLIRKLSLYSFRSILCLRNGRFQFYLTKLSLHGDDQAKLFTDAASLSSQQSYLKFLTSLSYCNLSDQTVKDLGAVIRSCEHLYMINVVDGEDSMCYLLEQVQNPGKCSVMIDYSFTRPAGAHVTSVGAVQLASLLPTFSNISTLHLDLRDCCSTALDTLVTSITHKTVKKLVLNGVTLTPEAAEVLGRSLPEMSSLKDLQLYVIDGSILQAEEVKALFGRLPLYNRTFRSSSEIGCLASSDESHWFLPNLTVLQCEKLNLDEGDLCGLLENWSFIGNLRELHVLGDQPGRVDLCTYSSFSSRLTLGGVNLTSAAATILGRILPQMSSLLTLKLTGVDGTNLQTKELEALFGQLYTPLPLHELYISGYDVRGSLVPLITRVHFLPNLTIPYLGKLIMDEDNQCGLLESLNVIPHLTSLRVESKPLVQGHCSPLRLTLTSKRSGLRTSKSLNLHGISLTPKTAASLGRSLPEMLSLETLELAGHGGILPAEKTEALFGGFNKKLRLSDLIVFPGFYVTGSIAPLTNSFRFFPNLVRLCLVSFNMDEHNLCGLLQSLRFLPKLTKLRADGGGNSMHCTAEAVLGFRHDTLRILELNYIDLTPAVALALGRLLPEMLSLQYLKLLGFPGNVLGAEKIKALFGGFNKTLPLVALTLDGFSTRGCLGPLAKSFSFFPKLEQCYLGGFKYKFGMDEHNLCALLETLRFIPNLKVLSVKGEPLGDTHCCTAEVNTVAKITHETLERLGLGHKTLERLELDGVAVTPVTAALLGRLLPKMSSLQALWLTGVYGSNLEAEDMKTLLGGLSKSWPLSELAHSGFSARGCLSLLIKSPHSFSSVKELRLEKLAIGQRDQCGLLESIGHILNLTTLCVHFSGNKCLDSFHYYLSKYRSKLNSVSEALDRVDLDGLSLTPAVAAALGKLLSEMSSLQDLQLGGLFGGTCVLGAKEMKALFSSFNKIMPLFQLTISDFSAGGSFAPLKESFRFFPRLAELHLSKLNMDEQDLLVLLESFQFIPNLQLLDLSRNPLGRAVRSIVPYVINLKKLRYLWIHETGLSVEDLTYVQQALPGIRVEGAKTYPWSQMHPLILE